MKYDVVIVGAGPSGSTAAKNLAEKGKKVLIIDKQKFPRDKPCGGGIPTRVMKQFPYIKEFIDSVIQERQFIVKFVGYCSEVKKLHTIDPDSYDVVLIFDENLNEIKQLKDSLEVPQKKFMSLW